MDVLCVLLRTEYNEAVCNGVWARREPVVTCAGVEVVTPQKVVCVLVLSMELETWAPRGRATHITSAVDLPFTQKFCFRLCIRGCFGC
jgi:hypothetical protein